MQHSSASCIAPILREMTFCFPGDCPRPHQFRRQGGRRADRRAVCAQGHVGTHGMPSATELSCAQAEAALASLPIPGACRLRWHPCMQAHQAFSGQVLALLSSCIGPSGLACGMRTLCALRGSTRRLGACLMAAMAEGRMPCCRCLARQAHHPRHPRPPLLPRPHPSLLAHRPEVRPSRLHQSCTAVISSYCMDQSHQHEGLVRSWQQYHETSMVTILWVQDLSHMHADACPNLEVCLQSCLKISTEMPIAGIIK